jgi:hypothetical protein
MESQQPPVYVVCPGRVYRRDTPDATHVPTFHQVEGLAVEEGITLGDLLGTLDYLCKALFGESRRTRFVTHHFPFTEPSVEALVSCHVCDGSGCPVCRHSGWIEVGGSGMVHPNLFEFVGYDPERYTGFAFGWGLERIAVLRHGIPDLRELWRNDPAATGAVLMRAPLSWLREYVTVDATVDEIAHRLAISSLEVERVIDVGVPDFDGNVGRSSSGACWRRVRIRMPTACACARSTWERATPGRSTAARGTSSRARLSPSHSGRVSPDLRPPLDERELRGQASRGMILAEDEVGLGEDHAGIMLLPDGLEPGTPLVDVLPIRDQVLDVIPTVNRVDLLSRSGLAREVAALLGGDLHPPAPDDPGDRGR